MSFSQFLSTSSFDISSLNNSDNDCSPLESWLRNYDSTNPRAASAGTVSSSLSSAFLKPTYTPSASFEPGPCSNLTKYREGNSNTSYYYDRYTSSSNLPGIFSSRLNHGRTERSLADSYTPPTYAPTNLIQTPFQIIGNYNALTLNLPPIGTSCELERLPGLRSFSLPPIQPPQPTPIDTKVWFMTENATTQQLDHAISRLFSELNWDFFASNFSILNRTGDAMTEQEWRANIVPGYETYVTLKAQGNEAAFSQNFQEGGYRVFVYSIISLFLDVVNNTKIVGLHNPTSERDKINPRKFWGWLVTGREIQTFPATRCANAGLSYPGH